jgi:uncharacterized protein (DUF302 family)
MSETKSEGLITIPSRHSVDETVVNIVSLLREKGIKLFAVIDHSGEAKLLGLKMPPTRLVIFGNPKAGTPLMLASPGLAIDLPLKLLVAEDGQGKISISYNAADYLGKRHHLPDEMLGVIAAVGKLAEAAAS